MPTVGGPLAAMWQHALHAEIVFDMPSLITGCGTLPLGHMASVHVEKHVALDVDIRGTPRPHGKQRQISPHLSPTEFKLPFRA